MHRSPVLFLALTLFACAGDDPVEEAQFAVDTDDSGEVDCDDLDHVLECLHRPDTDACAFADVNGDGAVDDADVHDIHDGLAASGHGCDEAEHHDAEGDHDAEHEGEHDGTHNDDGHDDGTGDHTDDGTGDHTDDGTGDHTDDDPHSP